MPETRVPSDSGLLLAIAALLAKSYQPNERDPRPAEQVLADAGLSYADIAAIVGKQPDAVRVALARARAKK